MRGVRAILALLSGMTLVETLLLLGMSPDEPGLVPFRYEWAWGIYASLGLSAAGVLVALRFGHADARETSSDDAAAASSGPSRAGRTVH
jgi:hypothetical protein